MNVTNLQEQDIANLDSTGENGKQVVNVGENGILLARATGDQMTSNLKDVVTNANGRVFVYHGTPEDMDTVTAGNYAQVNVNQGAQAQISNLTLGAGSQLNVAGGTYDGSLFAGQGANIQVDSGSAINITNGGTVRNVGINVSNPINTEPIRININIGNDQGAGHLALNNSTLTNAQVFLDPVWGKGSQGTYEGASTLTNPNKTVDYELTVGQNSIASIGTNAPTNAEQAFNSVTDVFGPRNRTAILYADSPISVADTGGILVDGSLTSANTTCTTPRPLATAGIVNFATGSALLVNGNGNFANDAVINGNSTILTVDPDAKGYFTGKIDGTVGSSQNFQLASNVDSDANAINWYTHPDHEHGIVAPWNFDITGNGSGSVTLTRRNWNALNGAMQNIVNGVWDSMPASTNGVSVTLATAALFGDYGSM